MDDLVQWLGAQLDEDERAARDVAPDAVASMARKFASDARSLKAHLAAGKSDRIPYDEGQADALHWASVVLPERMPPLNLWDQARVLREIEAKRGVVARYEFACREAAALGISEEEREMWVQVAGALQSCVLCLALPYADRPGYREEWRP